MSNLALSPITFNPVAAPSSPSAGTTYIDATTKRLTSYDGSAWKTYVASGDSTTALSIITANTTAVAGTIYVIEANTVTLTLPASPSAGNAVGVMVATGFSGAVVNPNGKNIEAVSGNMNVNVPRARFTLVYVDATNGWCFQ